MTTGVIYAVGASYAPRLVVSLHGLRTKANYSGPITILSVSPEAAEIAEQIKADEALNVEHLEIRKVQSDYQGTLATKTLLPAFTPYDVSLFIDADTLPVASIDELLTKAEEYPLVLTRFANQQFPDDVQDKNKDWSHLRPTVDPNHKFASRAPVINTGIFGFHRSFTKLANWASLAMRGIDLPVPDEMAMQLLLPTFDDKELEILDDRWNCSPRIGVNRDQVAIWHFHSNSHRDPNEVSRGWRKAFQRVIADNAGKICDWLV